MEALIELSKLIRYYCIKVTDEATSGHLTSSLSAVDLMTTLFFGGFLKYDTNDPENELNDRVIFSKGHASPLFYSLFRVAGAIDEKEILTYRKFGSRLEGHPGVSFPYAEVLTGSLGQGLSVGLGMALAGKMDHLDYKTYVLLGDGEMAEGSVWEAIQAASFYNAKNLVAVIDVNRLGQSGETMLGWNVKEYQKRIAAFGWETVVIDGHNFSEISQAFSLAHSAHAPFAIIARTVKGKGISELENNDGFHGKPLPHDKVGEAVKSLGTIDLGLKGEIAKPDKNVHKNYFIKTPPSHVAQYLKEDLIATREAYGDSLLSLLPQHSSLVALDGEVSNSTYSEKFKNKHPELFLEMFIEEQNMASVALGLSKRGKIPFASTFAAFWTRAHDQLRMAALSEGNIKFVGSHAGVSIGEDGPSQMGLEDIALFRGLQGSVIFYPSDAVSTNKLCEIAAANKGIFYIRTTRSKTPVIYDDNEDFEIGGFKVLRDSREDRVAVIGAGITLHEALKAYDQLKNKKITIKVIDLYCIKPIHSATLAKELGKVSDIITVEDHHEEGGIAEALRSALYYKDFKIHSLSVRKKPTSGKSDELLEFEEISASAIVKKVMKLVT